MNKVDWLDGAVFYEIYPQSFKDTNSDGIGDFAGIAEKLDYIKELGCTAIWMNPCYDSPFLDAGYDVRDYYLAAPRYGTNDDLKRLFGQVHERGMHILLDLVPGHTSWEHEWFRESCKAARNEYTDRYIWTDNTWEAPCGMNALIGISERVGACGVNFFSHQPALNYGYYKPDPAKPWQQSTDSEGAKATLEAMKDIMRFWLGMGCDGFRVDMAHSLVKNDEDGKGTIKLWQDVRAFLDREFPDAAMVSEWGEPDKSLLGGFHMDFLLHFGPSHYNDLFRCEKPFFGGNGDASEFVARYLESRRKAGADGLICIPSGNHDMVRLAKYLHGDELKMAFAFLLSMPGAPFIYYGDEIGMRYVEDIPSVEGGYERTGSRSPMQWDSTVNAGFSAAPRDRLYIPIDPADDRPTVEAQINVPGSLLGEVREMCRLRAEHKALQSRGDIEFICDGKPGEPLVYIRSCESGRVLVILNPTDKECTFALDEKISEPVYRVGKSAHGSAGGITAAPRSAGWYVM
ncbi:MAG: glycosylase [Ruminiclostridium sp.]|nr:glycosylase [Ruminiclostridium sp.]